jgi:hypothetical protein
MLVRRPLGETWCRWVDIKMGLKVMGHGVTYGFILLRIHYQTHVNAVMKLGVPYNAWIRSA